MKCFEDLQSARSFGRRLKLARGIDTSARHCPRCNYLHIIVGEGQLEETDRQILFKLAQGLTVFDISQDISLTYRMVENRIKALKEHFDALNVASLVATAIYLWAIDISDLMDSERLRLLHGQPDPTH